jgi:hypothetical protein
MDPGLRAEQKHQRLRLARFAMIVGLLIGGWPMLKRGATHLQFTLWKTTPEQARAALIDRKFHNFADPRADLQCVDGKPWWDFVCTYVHAPASAPTHRLKIGVRMVNGEVASISPPHPLDARGINP